MLDRSDTGGSWIDLPALERVRISGNEFTGCIPAGLLDDEVTGRTSDAEVYELPTCNSEDGS